MDHPPRGPARLRRRAEERLRDLRPGGGRLRRQRLGHARPPVDLEGGAYRPDHLAVRPRTLLPLRATRPDDGWCDESRDRRYNRPIRLPAPGVSAESMWRGDGLYDVVIDLDYNRAPIRKGRGSAIFLHIARDGYRPTEGCVALARADLLRLLGRLGPRTHLRIG
ncbi:L,D-transpeptidase family protein [Methylobacterium oryzae]|uniref:L,D-transpeptidase family protein n=1 Tax=Methylobacterium oryzae TaxID=334852 RepID=UPI003AF705A1